MRCPGPGHSPGDRSLLISFGDEHPDGFSVHSFSTDTATPEGIRATRDYVRECLGLPAYEPDEFEVDAEGVVSKKPKKNGARISFSNGNGHEPTSGELAYRARKKRKAAKEWSDYPLRKDGYKLVTTYGYKQDGKLLYEILRYEHPEKEKEFRARHPRGTSLWFTGTGEGPRVLYRRDEVLAAAATDPVFVTEGEKDADRLAGLGLAATTVAFGSWAVSRPCAARRTQCRSGAGY